MNKEKFLAFEKVRQSGATNMYDINLVILLAKRYGQDLSKKDCFDIMLNYDKYIQKYGVQNNTKHN